MTDELKARIKIARGYASGANAVAAACGYGIGNFITGNHHHTPQAMRHAAMTFQNAQKIVREGRADLATAKGRNP